MGKWAHGFFSLIFVGALNVGSIVLHFDPILYKGTNNEKSLVRASSYLNYQKEFEFNIECGIKFHLFSKYFQGLISSKVNRK